MSIGTIGEFNENIEDVCTYLELLDLWMAANGILSPGADDAQARLIGEFVYFYLLLGPTICPDKKLTVA